MAEELRREFENRDELVDYLKATFPEAAARDPHVADTTGGREAAEEALHQIDTRRYAKTRNYVDGAVTRLSPYIRYGVLSLAEVRDYAIEQVEKRQDVEKFVNELGWRDYWQRVYDMLGDGIWEDREPYKTGYAAQQYADEFPDDVDQSQTGMVCIDAFSRELRTTGYLHNHVRMYMAAYIVHWRQVKWQAGARWFLSHLLDGDPASNNLSWQWVASTFSHRPYIFNRENLERYTRGVYCRECPLYGHCDLEGSYDEINARLFPKREPESESKGRRKRKGSRR